MALDRFAKSSEQRKDEALHNIAKIVEIEKAQRAQRTYGERISEGIAAFAGSMFFVYIHVVWFSVWIIVNLLMRRPFDPFPFTFLTLVVSLEAIFLSTFILISQNHESKLTDRRNHLDLQVNMLAEQENTKMLELLKAVAEKLGVDCDDPAFDSLMQPVEPEKLVEEILKASDEELDEAAQSKEKLEEIAKNHKDSE